MLDFVLTSTLDGKLGEHGLDTRLGSGGILHSAQDLLVSLRRHTLIACQHFETWLNIPEIESAFLLIESVHGGMDIIC